MKRRSRSRTSTRTWRAARRSRAAVLDASGEVVVPRLLAMLSVVAVFVPSFFMTGVSRSLFVPLSLAVGFAMIASFLLSSSLVPVLSVWWLRQRHAPATTDPHAADWVERLRDRLGVAAAAAGAGARPRWSRPMSSSPSASSVGGRSDARARDLSAERRQGSSSCGSARRPARSSSRPSGSAATCST